MYVTEQVTCGFKVQVRLKSLQLLFKVYVTEHVTCDKVQVILKLTGLLFIVDMTGVIIC